VAAWVRFSENGRREADALRDLLARQLRRIESERQNYQPLAQLSLDLRSEEQRLQEETERRQREADRRSWDAKVERLESDLEAEPKLVREDYEVRAQRLDPVGLVYLLPED
jgi:hypothetical protein